MIAKLKQDSYENERRQLGFAGRYGREVHVTQSPNATPGLSSGSSPTFDDRERMSRPDVAQSRYQGYSTDNPTIDFDGGATQGYREEPRGYDQDLRINPRQELRPDPRHPLYQPFSQEPSYQLQTSSAAIDQA